MHACKDYQRFTNSLALIEEVLCSSLRGERFDIVIVSEVIEHVRNPSILLCKSVDFLCDASAGLLFVSTINDSILSRMLVVHLAEGVLNIVPRGTHDGGKFISPREVADAIYASTPGGPFISVRNVSGVIYMPVVNRWLFAPPSMPLINYFMAIEKRPSSGRPK